MGCDQPSGSLYRIEPGFEVTEMLRGIRVSNGLCWDERRGRFYYIDSLTEAIDIFDWTPDLGTISGRRILARLPAGEKGVPDGMTIDTEGPGTRADQAVASHRPLRRPTKYVAPGG